MLARYSNSDARALANELCARLCERAISREAHQLICIVSYLYPHALCALRACSGGPKPKLRARASTIATATGLPEDLVCWRLASLEAERLLEVGEDPLVPGRTVVWLTAEGEEFAAELAGLPSVATPTHEVSS